MKQLVAGVVTLALVVAGIVLATSGDSSAQENSDTTTTTVLEDGGDTTTPEDGPRGFFEFRFGGDLPAELEELHDCLTEQGIEIPDSAEPGFGFKLEGADGLFEALEACGIPGPGFPELPEDFPFGELPDGFPFDGDGLPEDFPFGELPDGFPFGDLSEDFPFGLFEGPRWDGELGQRFRFGGPGHGFGFGSQLLDRDELAGCLAELGTFENVDEVRAQLDECLPEVPFVPLEPALAPPPDAGAMRSDAPYDLLLLDPSFGPRLSS